MTALYGREASLEALRAAVASALAGRGQLVLVSGEAGIGKTTLAGAAAGHAEERGATVIWGRAWEFADAPPYFPIWPCLRSLGIGAGDVRDDHQAFELWENVVSALARAPQPVVWIVEDVHAADLRTLDLLTFLAQPLRAMRGLVVATARLKDPRVSERMSRRLVRMARDGLDLRLEALGEIDVAALVEEKLGRAVPAKALRRIVELTAGNPLFVVECARAFRLAGGIEGTLGSLPPTVRQVVVERLGFLPEATRHSLACGAVLGRAFSAATVALMNDSLPARIIDSLLPALRSGLIEETQPGDFVFRHALVRDAIDDAIAPSERAALHAKAARSLAGDTADILVERARHAVAAVHGDSKGAAEALALARRATDLLERDGAWDRAYELHARIDQLRRAGSLDASPADTLHMARVARAAGRSAEARRLCEELIAGARTAHDAELFAEATLLHAADIRPGVVDRSEVAWLEEARAMPNAGPTSCRVLARLATALQPAPDPSVPLGIARDAIAHARSFGDPALLLEVLDVAAWGLYYEPLPERMALAAERVDLALRANDLPKALAAYGWLALHHLEDGAFDAFHQVVETMLALSDELGHPRHRWRVLLLASARAITLGHFAESDRYVTEVAELAVLTDDPALPFALAAHDVMRSRVQRRDDPSLVDQLLPAMHEVWEAPLFVAVFRAACAARRQDADAVRAALGLVGARRTLLEQALSAAALLAEAYAIAGSHDDCRRLRDILARSSTREVVGGHLSWMYEGPSERLVGLLDAALGDLDSAAARLESARQRSRDRGHLPWVAQTTHELANVVERMGKDAKPLRDESQRIARELGMTGLIAQAEPRDASTESAAARASVTMTQNDAKTIWTITRGGTSAKLKASRGIELLARLVERPGEEIHVLALASDDPSASAAETDAGEVLDDRAKSAYRQRLDQLDEQIAEAKERNPSRTAKLERERATLIAELARATGLAGRTRRAGSATERARVNVQRRVKDAIGRVREIDDELGRFFEASVHTGTFCCFRPK